MNEFVNLLSSPKWWLTTVILALVLNLASAYLKGPLDRAIGRFSDSRRRSNAVKAAKRERLVARLRESPALQIAASNRSIVLCVTGSFMISLSLFCLWTVSRSAALRAETPRKILWADSASPAKAQPDISAPPTGPSEELRTVRKLETLVHLSGSLLGAMVAMLGLMITIRGFHLSAALNEACSGVPGPNWEDD